MYTEVTGRQIGCQTPATSGPCTERLERDSEARGAKTLKVGQRAAKSH
jgi:hypothetical protein